MSCLRDEESDFVGAIGEAADKLGTTAVFIEKDYWVTQVLRALYKGHAGSFVFKGGTSLSKGYGLIERFSEDVDILVTPGREDSARIKEARLEAMAEDVARDLGLEMKEERKPGRGQHPHRADWIVYPRKVRGTFPAAIKSVGVLLETGFAGGDWPGEMVTLKPMLCEPLELSPDEYEDTAEFKVRALIPMRTLLEKLSLLHHVATRVESGETGGDERCGRHYYDIYNLLGDGKTCGALEKRGDFDRVVSEMQEISAEHYGASTPRPEDGFAESPAFAATRGTDTRTWLEGRFNDAQDLLPEGAPGGWPTFENVLKRVRQYRELL